MGRVHQDVGKAIQLARRKKVIARTVGVNTKQEPVPSQPTVLTRLNLSVNDEVRFRKTDNENWTTAIVKGESKDGSLTLFDGHGMRAIMPDKCERKMQGPRGGVTWESIIPG